MSTRKHLLLLSAGAVSLALMASATVLAQKATDRKIGGPDTFPAIKGAGKSIKGAPGSDRAIQDVSEKKAKKGSKGGESAIQDASDKKAKKGKRAYPQGSK